MTPNISVFDCFLAKVGQDGLNGYEVSCAAGHNLCHNSLLGNINYRRVERGDPLCLKACQGCGDFDCMGEPEILPDDEKGWVGSRRRKGRQKWE